MSTKPHVVRPGEYLSQLAWRHGFEVGDVWHSEKNADLRAARTDPEMLAPGDLLFIPKGRTSAIPVQVASTNTFVAAVPTTRLRLHFAVGGVPVATERCVFSGLSDQEGGETDDSGLLELAVPVNIQMFGVHFPRIGRAYQIRPGLLDPVSETTGVRSRLRNLGFIRQHGVQRPTKEPTKEDRDLRAAVSAFQRAQGLPASGALDDETRATLARAKRATQTR